MSDRIDELAEAIDASLDTPHPALNELATIAREYLACARKAEAMCEWLAEALVDDGWCKPGPETPCTEDGELCGKCALKAAEDAVGQK